MANVLVQDTSLTAIADAIRAKNGEATLYKPSEMAAAITAIPTGGGSGGEVNQITATFPFSFSSTAGSKDYTVTGTDILDLTQYGVKEDFSNFVSLIFDCRARYWQYMTQSGIDKSRYLARTITNQKIILENGKLVLNGLYKAGEDNSLYISNSTVNNIEFRYDDNYSHSNPVWITNIYLIIKEEA